MLRGARLISIINSGWVRIPLNNKLYIICGDTVKRVPLGYWFCFWAKIILLHPTNHGLKVLSEHHYLG
jgi:hypothetical protein